MNKLALSLLIGIMFIGMISAEDVLYINSGDTNQKFLDIMDEIDISYEVVDFTNIYDYDTNQYLINYDDYGMILLNDENFPSLDKIPINEKPLLAVNSYHVVDFGWATSVIALKNIPTPLHIGINTSSSIAGDLPLDIQVYTSSKPNMYVLDRLAVYSGFEIVGFNKKDSGDIVVGFIPAGTTLTKKGKPDTQVNANSVFFGIHDTQYWTPETEQLFKNALSWLVSENADTFSLPLTQGQNLVSFPLILDSYTVSNITAGNSNIVSVKGYNNQQIASVSTVVNNKGYFIEASADTTLSLRGENPSAQQIINLQRGMNLVGITSLSNIDADDLPSGVIEVSRLTSNGEYEVATRYNVLGITWWKNEFSLEPGRGYWLKVNQDGVVWSYTP